MSSVHWVSSLSPVLALCLRVCGWLGHIHSLYQDLLLLVVFGKSCAVWRSNRVGSMQPLTSSLPPYTLFLLLQYHATLHLWQVLHTSVLGMEVAQTFLIFEFCFFLIVILQVIEGWGQEIVQRLRHFACMQMTLGINSQSLHMVPSIRRTSPWAPSGWSTFLTAKLSFLPQKIAGNKGYGKLLENTHWWNQGA